MTQSQPTPSSRLRHVTTVLRSTAWPCAAGFLAVANSSMIAAKGPVNQAPSVSAPRR